VSIKIIKLVPTLINASMSQLYILGNITCSVSLGEIFTFK